MISVNFTISENKIDPPEFLRHRGSCEGQKACACPSRVDRILDLLPRQRQIAQPFSGGDGVGDRRRGRPLPGFAAAEERLFQTDRENEKCAPELSHVLS
jgi:hypothetical protein